jgi:hypothetical protein
MKFAAVFLICALVFLAGNASHASHSLFPLGLMCHDVHNSTVRASLEQRCAAMAASLEMEHAAVRPYISILDGTSFVFATPECPKNREYFICVAELIPFKLISR